MITASDAARRAAVLVTLALVAAGCVSYPAYPRSPQFQGDHFENPPGWPRRPDGLAFLRWRMGRRSPPPVDYHPPRVANDGAVLRGNHVRASVTWIGHATTLIQAGGLNVLTDPVYADHVGLFERLGAPGVAIRDLPTVDVVVISHNHRDHLDADTIDALWRRFPTLRFVVPLGVGVWLRARGIPGATELDWWESVEIEARGGRARITLVPAQHWSQRDFTDLRKTLWGGYVVDGGGTRFYFAGDTGWPAAFPEIGRRFPGIDFALLPIGAYAPRWFMLPQHIGPGEAAQAFRQLGARVLVPIHWGTFHLSDEPMEEPPPALLRALGKDADRVARLPIGGTAWGPPASSAPRAERDGLPR